MRVEIGPVPLACASAWLDYASGVISELRIAPRAVTTNVIASFSKYVDEWQTYAGQQTGDVFRWTGDAAPETVEYLVFALYRLGVRLTEEQEGGLREPPSVTARKFHTVLVRSLLATLEREGEGEAHFVRQLREVWAPANERA
ncbi:MAG: hypothetical protein JWL83_909 [Actinomycetia bacterium]|jgi:hypothetical protein|nr:hypothetical protein [Actinomycetes bacterium]